MRIEKSGHFSKVKDGIAYGWAIVSTIKGEPYVDLHGDWIPPETLAPVAAEFMARSRVGKDMHAGDPIADVVFCLPVDGDVEKGIGLRDEQERTGLVIGWKPSDPAILSKIASGERVGFSIGGVLVEAEEKRLAKQAPTDKANQHKRTFRSWKLHEISLVDQPAQEGALVGIVKRQLAVAKSADKRYLTDEVQGHQHEVCVYEDGTGAWMTDATAEGAQAPHRHTVIRDTEGQLVVLADSGHTHTLTEMPLVIVAPDDATVVPESVAARAPSNSTRSHKSASVATNTEKTMDELAELKALKEKLEAKIAELESQLVEAKADAELTDEEKAHIAGLSTAEAKRFRSLEKAARRAEVEKLRAVEYTADDGTVYRKCDDPRMIALAKRADEEARKRIEAEVSKRVGEFFKGAPGKPDALKDLLKAAESIKGEVEIDGKTVKRSDECVIALKALANNAALYLTSKSKAPGFGGIGEPEADDSPAAKLDALTEKLAQEKGIEKSAARVAVMKTEEGRRLYAESVGRG